MMGQQATLTRLGVEGGFGVEGGLRVEGVEGGVGPYLTPRTLAPHE